MCAFLTEFPPPKEKLGLLEVIASVLSAMLGIQKNAVRERDFTSGKPYIFILVGILITVLFVLSLIFLVNFVLAHFHYS